MNNFFKGKHGPLLIAEIGGNHEGDFNYALKLTKLAIKADVDVIKYQIYTGSTLVNKIQSPKRFSHFKKFELSKDQHIKLANICIENNIQYSASVWDLSVLDWIDPFLKFYKIGSGDLTAYSLLNSISKRNKPIILSTGLSNLDEIRDTVGFIIKKNPVYKSKQFLSILQCTSLYPNKDKNVNLNVIKTLKNTFEYPIGYSDHTTNSLALKTAFSMGAEILEFHFTDDRLNKTFRDHHISLNFQEVKELIRDIKKIKILFGSNKKYPTNEEITTNHIQSFRRAVYLKKDFKIGEIITEKDLISLRPNTGIDAREIYRLIGKSVNQSIKAYHPLDWSMIS